MPGGSLGGLAGLSPGSTGPRSIHGVSQGCETGASGIWPWLYHFATKTLWCQVTFAPVWYAVVTAQIGSGLVAGSSRSELDSPTSGGIIGACVRRGKRLKTEVKSRGCCETPLQMGETTPAPICAPQAWSRFSDHIETRPRPNVCASFTSRLASPTETLSSVTSFWPIIGVIP